MNRAKKSQRGRGAAARLATDTHITLGKTRMPISREIHEPLSEICNRAAAAISAGAPVGWKDRYLVSAHLRNTATDLEVWASRDAKRRPTLVLAEHALDAIRCRRNSRKDAILDAMGPGKYDQAKFLRIGKALDRLLKRRQKRR